MSFFRNLASRELTAFRVRRRAFLGDLSSEDGVLMVEHDGDVTPPLAVSFCKTSRNSYILGVSDEDGYVSLYDTRRRLPSFATSREKSVESRVKEWVAHENTIFDICWMKDDTHILTASGDQSVRIWNVEKMACIGIMTGHTGSVKSLCSHQSNEDIVVSGSRDGSFAMWDLRCKTNSSSRGTPHLFSTVVIKDAHISSQKKNARRGKTASKSITSVLCLKDGVSIASAGAADSVVKFWDTRSLKSSITQASPCSEPTTEMSKPLHGVSSLSQDSHGTYLAASCMDNMIYLYNMFQLDKGPVKTFSGSTIGSFYVKAAISPDAGHILSGSSDGNAYIWQVNAPGEIPIKLEGHEGEVTAVDWCSSDTGKLATSSDDYMVRVWNPKEDSFVNTRPPISSRKRVQAIRADECSKMVINSPPTSPTKTTEVFASLGENFVPSHSPTPTKENKYRTPECGKKRSSHFDITEGVETTKNSFDSPSSVLSPPPSSKKRTIRDYFFAPA